MAVGRRVRGSEAPAGLEAIASVLTYVRREWGQAGAPVHPAAVQAIRAAAAERRRPWTDEELRQLEAAGRGD